MHNPLTIIGWCEMVGLPDLGIDCLRAKMDTGAKVSALHAYDLEFFQKEGCRHARFHLYPFSSTPEQKIYEFPVVAKRIITDTSGRRETRAIIKLKVKLGPWQWPVEVSLTSRHHMRFPLLLGRRALRRHFAIDPSKRYLFGKKNKECI